MLRNNTLLRTDVYKMGHMEQYHPETTEVYSYFCSRSDKNYRANIFFGLQYYLLQYICQPITHADAAEWLKAREYILGKNSALVTQRITALAELGYWPIEIKALPEGTMVPVKNALFTIRTTHPDFFWAGGFLESLLLKVWYPSLVPTTVHEYRKLVDDFFNLTEDDTPENRHLRNFMVHDFGYRSDSSEESAALSGAGFLIPFMGSDTVVALPFIRDYYSNWDGKLSSPWFGEGNQDLSPMYSIPASEHSVACSFGKDGELDYFKRMLELYPDGLVSLISDTYNIWQVIDRFLPELKPMIMERDGKAIFRPDSGNPPDIICGNPEKPDGSPERAGVLKLLDKNMGHTWNSKGYKNLDRHVGLVYGDGMYLQRYKLTLERMRDMRFGASNLVIGIGGIARAGTRDTLGNAIKATHLYRGEEAMDIFKDPITDSAKKSHKGLFSVYRDEDGIICTKDQATEEEEAKSLLQTVLRNRAITKRYTFREVRQNYLDSRF